MSSKDSRDELEDIRDLQQKQCVQIAKLLDDRKAERKEAFQ